jgi:hypothetical protein
MVVEVGLWTDSSRFLNDFFERFLDGDLNWYGDRAPAPFLLSALSVALLHVTHDCTPPAPGTTFNPAGLDVVASCCFWALDALTCGPGCLDALRPVLEPVGSR